MKCPSCLHDLIPGEMQKAETFAEHVGNPYGVITKKPTIICQNENCQVHKDGVFWLNEEFTPGEGPYHTIYKHDYDWYNGNYGPIPSLHRKINVEIYNHGQKDTILLFTLKKWKIYLKYYYQADKMGNVLKISRKLNIIQPDDIFWINPFNMIKYCLKIFYGKRKDFIKNPSKRYAEQLLDQYKDIEMKFDNCEWWRKFVYWYLNIFHSKLKVKLQKEVKS